VDSEEDFIPFIYNYCDRWCERCGFSERCRIFAEESEMTDEEKEIGNEAFVRNLTNILAQAAAMLADKAEEFGIEVDREDVDLASVKYEQKRGSVRVNELARLAEEYAWSSRPILESRNEWLIGSPVDEEVQSEVLKVLYWYQFFISAKIQRGLEGILDEDGNEDHDEINDLQSDANGSVKIAIIAIERSILAWTYLLAKENSEIVRPMIRTLEKILRLAEQKFPNARDFVRPGFDEIETVM
jgi:hypothetical protein